MEVKVGVSNRHVHLTKEHLEILCGKDASLEKRNDLTQPGEFASSLTLTIKTPKSEMENVRVLGPLRSYTQVEISRTDSYKLGLNPPVRNSGDLNGSEPITLIGPYGEVTLESGCIIATRHLHITKEGCEKNGLIGLDEVSVKVPGEKGAILYHVSLKMDESYTTELHLDTDDGNACNIKTGDILDILTEKID